MALGEIQYAGVDALVDGLDNAIEALGDAPCDMFYLADPKYAGADAARFEQLTHAWRPG
jgi:hypothetical protein